MRRLNFFIFFIFATFLNANSCYKLYDLQDENEISYSVYIFIDETFKPDSAIKNQLYRSIHSLISPNNYFYIAKFSAFIDDNYNKKIYDIKIEDKMKNGFFTSKTKLKKLDKCIKDQKNFAKIKLQNSIEEIFTNEKSDIPKSEILYALKDFSDIVKTQKSKKTIVIILSDMLENSSITSFYNQGSLRIINATDEIKKVEKADLFANFNGAYIYVIGAGFVGKGGYKNHKTLNHFKSFWQKYFLKSNSNLVEFAMPLLKSEIK